MPHSYTNTQGSALCEALPEAGLHLLDVIWATREGIGEGLNDDGLTRLLLLSTELPTEAGFTFLSFSGGIVTLSVPNQDLAKWYPGKGLIAPEKEKTAKAIAKKYGLSVFEPPDVASFRYLNPDDFGVHHHLELASRAETVVFAHPRYLKVRLDCKVSDGVIKPLDLGPDLLQDLSALYRG